MARLTANSADWREGKLRELCRRHGLDGEHDDLSGIRFSLAHAEGPTSPHVTVMAEIRAALAAERREAGGGR